MPRGRAQSGSPSNAPPLNPERPPPPENELSGAEDEVEGVELVVAAAEEDAEDARGVVVVVVVAELAGEAWGVEDRGGEDLGG